MEVSELRRAWELDAWRPRPTRRMAHTATTAGLAVLAIPPQLQPVQLLQVKTARKRVIPGHRNIYRRGDADMGIGVSLILAAAGAILIWAVDVEVSGVDLTVVGVILLIVGIVGALLSLVFWSSWGGFGGGYSRDTIVRDRDRVVER